MQVEFANAGSEVEADLALQGERLQRDRAVRTTDQHIGAETAATETSAVAPTYLPASMPAIRLVSANTVQTITPPVVMPISRPTVVMVPV